MTRNFKQILLIVMLLLIGYLPKASKKVVFKNADYTFYKGKYYRNMQGRYILVSPPTGLRVNVLPVGFVTIHIGRDYYYYDEGVYYREIENEYEVVNPPVGAIVFDLPVDAEVVIYEGKVYYEYFDILYKKVETPKGDAYEIVGQLED